LEIWFDWLGFVPRRRLGEIVPQIGDLRFGSIVQKFLHGYGEITIGPIDIVGPYEEHHPRVHKWKNNRPLVRIQITEAQMPANIKNFNELELRFAIHFFLII
jgi:hypothetical protein